jgi:hypothetical protein
VIKEEGFPDANSLALNSKNKIIIDPKITNETFKTLIASVTENYDE